MTLAMAITAQALDTATYYLAAARYGHGDTSPIAGPLVLPLKVAGVAIVVGVALLMPRIRVRALRLAGLIGAIGAAVNVMAVIW